MLIYYHSSDALTETMGALVFGSLDNLRQRHCDKQFGIISTVEVSCFYFHASLMFQWFTQQNQKKLIHPVKYF